MDAISWQLLIEGAWTTLWISAIAIAFGVVAGLLIALVRMLRLPVIDQLLVVYISLARATPLVTLVLFLFLSLPTMGMNLDKNVAAIVALTLNTSAFNAEIWRNAFRTFPREQREAAESVGMRRWTYFRYIMLPQMWIESLPALVNEMSFLIKVARDRRDWRGGSHPGHQPYLLGHLRAAVADPRRRPAACGDHRLFVEAAGYRGT